MKFVPVTQRDVLIDSMLNSNRRHTRYMRRFSFSSLVVELLVYAWMLIPAWCLWNLLWFTLITDKFYYCSDSMGLDFMSPPFVHPPNSPTSPYSDLERSQQLLGYGGDFYLNRMNETTLNLVWVCFLLGTVATPGAVFCFIQRLDAWLVKLRDQN